MPQGRAGTKKQAEALAARRAAGGSYASLYFKITPDAYEFARFVEDADSYKWAMFHEIPRSDRQWGDFVVCLDQDDDGERQGDPCPGCDADLKRSYKGFIRVIWRNAPVYKKDKDNKIIKDQMGDPVILGHEDQIALWTSGINLFTNLDEQDETFRGLNRRDWKIKREGQGTSTKYIITPRVDPDTGETIKASPFSDNDRRLIEETSIDLAQYIKPPTYEEFDRMLRGGQRPSGNGSSSASASRPAARPANPFMRRD